MREVQNKVYDAPLEIEDEAVFECLVCYWIEQGIPKDHAEHAARKALERIWMNNGDGTWVLLPNI